MKKIFFLFILVTGISLWGDELIINPIEGIRDSFIRGADISMLSEIEKRGGLYYDVNGNEKDFLLILKENGVNWVRLRLWHTPVNPLPVIEGGKIISNKGQPVGGGNCSTEAMIELAVRAKSLGFKVLLDFHFSDFWADPGKQNKPWAWKDMDLDELGDAVFLYTKETLIAFRKAGAFPDMVQIGNELNNGMLWPEGKIWGNDSGGMEAFLFLMKQASKGVRRSDPLRWFPGKRIKIAVHLAEGGDNQLYRSVFTPLIKGKLDFDIIGLSYYPYWHGSLEELSNNMNDLAQRFGKEMVIMETAYAYTTEDGDSTGNVFKIYNGDEGGYLPSVQGQATVVRDVMETVAMVDNQKGLGVFYWEPGWIPVTGAGWRTGEGNAWENQAMFDFSGKALPSLHVFSRVLDTQNKVDIKPIYTEALEINATIGETIDFPTEVKTIYSDDSWRYAPVNWEIEEIPLVETEKVLIIPGKLTGSGGEAELRINYTRFKNLIPDPSFESGEMKGWKKVDPAGAALVESNASNAHTGDWTYKYWAAEPFTTKVYRSFSDIPNGRYTLRCWSMGGGGENSITLFAKNYGSVDSVELEMTNNGWQNWNEYTLTDIEVINHKCTIGIEVDAQGGNWGNFDDFQFYLEQPE